MATERSKRLQKVEHVQRPLMGLDILRFQGRHGLDRNDTSYYLGLSNFLSYQKHSAESELDYSLELLIRLYDEDPSPPPFKKNRINLHELFDKMFADKLKVFAGTGFEPQAKVDMQNRFAKMLGRSKGRAYLWLNDSAIQTGVAPRAHSEILAILGKLTQRDDPAGVLDRLSKMIWKLRGEDIDETYPVPTLKDPPKRSKRGRRPKPEAEKVQKSERAAKAAPSRARAKVKSKTPARKGKIEVTLKKVVARKKK